MTVALFDRQTRNGTDRDIRSFAGTTLPILQHHLQMAAAVDEQRDDEPLIRTGVVARAVSIERCAFRGPTVVSAKAETQRLSCNAMAVIAAALAVRATRTDAGRHRRSPA